MAVLKAFSDVLQEFRTKKKTGALYISVAEASENLVRFYFKEGEICNLSYGPVKDRECLDLLDCYSLGKAVYFDGMKAPTESANLPKTDVIIAMIKRKGTQIQTD